MKTTWRSSKEAVYGTRKPLLRALVLLAVIGAVLFFVRMKKEGLVREGANFLQTLLSRETKLDVKIGKISGKINGVIRFDDVSLEDQRLPDGLRVLFRAERIEFRYRPWEFLTKNFRARIDVSVTDPELYWRPSVRLRSDSFPLFNWLRDLVLAQHQSLRVHVKNLTLIAGADRQEFSGIDVDYADDRFEISAPLRHTPLWGNDLNSEVKLRAQLDWGFLKSDDRLIGQLTTEGSVMNWQPLPWESRVDFALTRESLTIDSSDFLGGFELTGQVRFARGGEADLALQAKSYPLKNFEPFFGRNDGGAYDGELNFESRFQGPLDALRTEMHAMIRGGKIGQEHYRVMTLQASGVYPTLTLEDSHLLMQDGVLMKFADKTVEFRELFSSGTYKNLIIGNAQENVSLGDWGFKRPIDENQMPEFLMERSLGRRARLQFRKYNEPQADTVLEPVAEEDKQDMEVGFAFRLRAEDTLKYTVREDEQFVGIERKMSF